jgi:membrane associated rhomboid family serine protease
MHPASVGFQCPDDVRAGSRSIRTTRTSAGARLRESPPYVTIALIVVNVGLYLYTGLQSTQGLNDLTGSKNGSLFNDWQLQPQAVHAGHYYELITSAFLHLSLLHIGSNMLALGILGPPLEALLGRWRFTAVYVLSGLGGSAAIYAFDNPLGTTVGASGAIFGLFGAAVLMYRQLRIDPQYLIGTIVLNFVLTFSIPGISKLGHIGGFITGLLAGVAIVGLPSHWFARTSAPRKGNSTVRTPTQVAGLAAIAAVILIVIGVRSATW